MNRIYYIYRIVNTHNQKSYVGWSIDPIRRWKRHLYAAFSGKVPRYKLHESLQKYGEKSFSLEVLYCSKDENHVLHEMEPYFIEKFKSMESGYNSTKGGQGNTGWKPSRETREKISKAHRGKTLSESHKRQISERMKKNPLMHNPEIREKVSKSLKAKGIRPILTEEQLERKRLNQIGKPIHTEKHKKRLSEKFKKENPMWNKEIKEKARKNKKGKGTGSSNGRAVFAKIFNPGGDLVAEGYLREICEKENFPFGKFLKNSRSEKPLMRGIWKKWNIVQIPNPAKCS